MIADPKPKTYRNPRYLTWLRGQSCLNCGSRETEPHHIRHIYWNSGVGHKGHDYISVPLCRKCHSEQHAMPYLDKTLVEIERIIIDQLMRYIEETK